MNLKPPSFLVWLKGRGLKGIELITSDDHGGLVKMELTDKE
ncbi:MAG: hypothetical protein GX883_06035 [Firmicutes bacterium]|nr:hypothetical protein [Bacillota bacterium]